MAEKTPNQEELSNTLKEIVEAMVHSVSTRDQLKKLIKTNEEIDEAWLRYELNQIR